MNFFKGNKQEKIKKQKEIAKIILHWVAFLYSFVTLTMGIAGGSVVGIILSLLLCVATLPIKKIREIWHKLPKYKAWKKAAIVFLVFIVTVSVTAASLPAEVETETKDDFSVSETVSDDTSYEEKAEENVSSEKTSKEDKPSEKKPSSVTSSTTASKPTSVGAGHANPVTNSGIPAYSGSAYVTVNNNIPNFSSSELKTTGYENYSNLDGLGRTQVAIACVGKDTMPGENEKRGSISSIKPTGWKQATYDNISGKYLYNRCHLIGWQLSAENANKNNLITGTKYLNIEGMLPFENMVADYIKETENHVAYRVTPIYEGNNLLASGVQIEAYSVEDNGAGICFNVYCYNVQPGITINYTDGSSSGPSSSASTSQNTSSVSQPTVESTTQPTVESTPAAEPAPEPTPTPTPDPQPSENNSQIVYKSEIGSKYHSKSVCGRMKNGTPITKSEAIALGLEPCKNCY